MSSGRITRGGQTTASMAVYENDPSRSQELPTSAGLVTLYAPRFRDLQPAFPLRQPENVIGREPPAEILVPQPAVSRRHARLFHDGQGWCIQDLGARNGTLVNGVFVEQCQLQHGDELRVGDAFFKFVRDNAEGYLPYRLDGAVVNAYATPSGIVGGYQLAQLSSALERISKSNMSVMVLGESGTGKEVFARQIHRWSERTGSFSALNCAAIPATLLESELFGYRRGAFSGADRDHVGLVRTADRGTLFLDEVGDLPLEAQAKLLRVLQTKEVLPLGATAPEQVDVRIVGATHRDLQQMQETGTFRRDLYARLNEYALLLPPLRARKEDIYALCLEFLRLHKRPDLELTVPYMTGLLHHDFPYNVRELEALIKRGIALVDGAHLDANHLSAEIHKCMIGYGRRADSPGISNATPEPRAPAPSWVPPPVSTPKASGGPTEPPSAAAASEETGRYSAMSSPSSRPPSSAPSEEQLREALVAMRGNVAAVGRLFGKERMQVHRWMKKFGIDPDGYRS